MTEPTTFQHNIFVNPFQVFYEECCNHTGDERLNFVLNLSATFNLFPRKVKKKDFQQQIKSDDYDDALLEVFDELKKKIAPKYNAWHTEIAEKHGITFSAFIKRLDTFFSNLEEETTKDGSHFLRKPTSNYRKKYNLKADTKFTPGLDKPLSSYFTKIIGDYAGYLSFSNYNPTDDTIQIDHVLSCQVFAELLKKSEMEYSFDRYYSLRSWLNKCWNFIILPSCVNNRKGHIEKKIILIIKKLDDLSKDTINELSDDEKMLLKDYFSLVVSNMQTYLKSDFLGQMKNLKKFLLEFFNNVGAPLDEASCPAEYVCDDCFCLKTNQSKRDRFSTFHLFTDFELPGDLKEFTANMMQKFASFEEPPKKPGPKARAKAYYQNKRAKIKSE